MATIRTMSGGAPKEIFLQLTPQFERRSGHKVDYVFAVMSALRDKLAAGEKADVLVMPTNILDGYQKDNIVRAQGRAVLGLVSVNAVVRTGTAKPDLSTPEKVKQAMLNSSAITHATPGATPSGTHMGKLVEQLGIADAMKGKYRLCSSASFDIVDAASRLDLHLRDQGVLRYRRIVFVAHSMGGLVVLQELLTNTEVRDKVPVVVLLATPQEGADITRIAELVSNNAALPQMSTDDGNTLIRTMNNQWNSIVAERRPHVRCAYETVDTYGTRVVRWASATRFCEGQPTPISANHVDIVKPNAGSLDAVRVVTSAMTDYVFDRKLVTPDFRMQGNTAVLNLATALGQQPARLENSGTARLYYTLAEPSDPALFMWPETTDTESRAKARPRFVWPSESARVRTSTSSCSNPMRRPIFV